MGASPGREFRRCIRAYRMHITTMINQKIYEADDMMIDLISDNYNVLQVLGSFGINMGFGDKTVKDVCKDNNVDSATFLAVVNYAVNGHYDKSMTEKMDVPTLLHYLQANHKYYLDYQLPSVRKELEESLMPEDKLEHLILDFYDAYASEVRKHMKYEEKTLFPYVQGLLEGRQSKDYSIEFFSKHHAQADVKLKELKNIIIKYLPGDNLRNNRLTATLYNLYNNEQWLLLHENVENEIFVPVIRSLEDRVAESSGTAAVRDTVEAAPGSDGILSSREKEVVVCVVKGMSNKEIADTLFISVNTVLTHRRNIARKLKIHSSAGLTIYAIANNLIAFPGKD